MCFLERRDWPPPRSTVATGRLKFLKSFNPRPTNHHRKFLRTYFTPDSIFPFVLCVVRLTQPCSLNIGGKSKNTGMPHDLAAIRLQSLHPTVENLFPVLCPTVESLLHAFELMSSAAFDPLIHVCRAEKGSLVLARFGAPNASCKLS
jgi:hypothetical protein